MRRVGTSDRLSFFSSLTPLLSGVIITILGDKIERYRPHVSSLRSSSCTGQIPFCYGKEGREECQASSTRREKTDRLAGGHGKRFIWWKWS